MKIEKNKPWVILMSKKLGMKIHFCYTLYYDSDSACVNEQKKKVGVGGEKDSPELKKTK